MPDAQIIKVEKSGWSGSMCVSGDSLERPSARFILLGLQLRLLLLKSPILTESNIEGSSHFVKYILPILTKLRKLTSFQGLTFRTGWCSPPTPSGPVI